MPSPPLPVVPLNILYPNGQVEAVQLFIWDTALAQPVLWDGAVNIGSITIGEVDQGASGTDPWTVNLTKVGGTAFALGQQLAAASLPIVLTASQLSTLTPPAAITGFATAAKQDTGNTSLASIDTKIPALGQALAAASVPVVLTAAQLTTLTPLSSVTVTQATASSLNATVTGSGSAGSAATGVVTVQGIASMTKLLVTPDSVALPANQSVNVNQLAGTTTDTNSGTKSAGTLRVVLATDQPALTNKLLVTPDLPSGASTAAKQPALGTAGTASTDVITVQGIASMTKLLVTPDSVALPANQSVNVNQLAGTTTDTNSGNKSAGTLRVVLATDQPALTNKLLVTPDANSAVNVAQINGVTPLMGAGNTGTGSPRVTIATDQAVVPVKVQPATSGGFTTSHLVSAGSTNATVVKASAGQLFGWYIYNSNAAARKVAFHNTASTPTAGASIFFSMVLPPTSAANVMTETGIAFSSGIAFTMVTGLADSDATAVAANDLILNLWYA